MAVDRRLVLPVLLAGTSTVVAAVATSVRGWTPVGEFAQAEFRIGGFWSAPPQLGAVGRLAVDGVLTQHPGPLAWWAMYPVYTIAGGGGAALTWATALMAFVWVAIAVALASRHGGRSLGLAVAVAWLLLLRATGSELVVEPWNPWFAVPPFMCLVVAVWAAVRGSNRSFVIVLVAGSFAVQAHLGYLPLVAAGATVALVVLARRKAWSWMLAAGAAWLCCWALPLRQQLVGEPGNISQIVRAFTEPGEPAAGWGTAMRVAMSTLDLSGAWWIGAHRPPDEATIGVGTLAFLVLWASAITVAVRAKDRAAIDLHVLLGGSVVAGIVTTSRILGTVHDYLVPWWSVLGGLIAAACAWTAWRATSPWRGEHSTVAWRALVVVPVIAVALFGSVSASEPYEPGDRLSPSTRDLVSQLGGSVRNADRYLIRWEDPASFGAIGYGLVAALDRDGFDVGGIAFFRPALTDRLVVSETEGRRELMVVSGARLPIWQSWPTARRIAMTDPRSPAERRAWPAMRAELRAELAAVGGRELADRLDTNVFLTRSDPRVSRQLRDRVDSFAALGVPTAVFELEPGTTGPPA